MDTTEVNVGCHPHQCDLRTFCQPKITTGEIRITIPLLSFFTYIFLQVEVTQ